jgi:hypothetical protein
MQKGFVVGLLSGFVLSFLFIRGKLGGHFKNCSVGRQGMTAEDKVIANMQKLVAERPEIGTPDHAFVRDWAYGNAGLEDERITVEQVEKVLRERSA